MNKLYKFVSGRGLVEMDEAEMAEFNLQPPVEENEPESLGELSKKVDRILKALSSLKLLSSLGGNEGE